MKKTLCLVFLLVPALIYAADFEVDKGAVSIGGSAAFASYGGDLYKDAEDNSLTYFSIEPEVQYFVIPGLGIGGSAGFTSQSQGDFSMTVLSIGPSVQYYFLTESELIYPSIGGMFHYQSESIDFGGGMDSSADGTKFRFFAGAMFKLVDHFGLEAGLFYDMDSQKGDWDGAESESGSVFGVRIGFKGFIY